MTSAEAKAQMELATQAGSDQRKANQAVLDSAFDAADRAIMQAAAKATIEIAKAPAAADPT